MQQGVTASLTLNQTSGEIKSNSSKVSVTTGVCIVLL
jgi:hypothetical protein